MTTPEGITLSFTKKSLFCFFADVSIFSSLKKKSALSRYNWGKNSPILRIWKFEQIKLYRCNVNDTKQNWQTTAHRSYLGTAYFYKNHLNIATPFHLCVVCGCSALQWQSCVEATESIWPAKLKYLSFVPL